MSFIYRIRIKCQLASYWTQRFDGFTLANLEDGSAELLGCVKDQAALHHTLEKLRDLNIELVSVELLEDGVVLS